MLQRSSPQPHWIKSSNAPDSISERRSFRVTHPFHPLYGHEFELINIAYCWGDERVFYVDETKHAHGLPARWTNAVAEDPFVVISAGRSDFRLSDLLQLVEIIKRSQR